MIYNLRWLKPHTELFNLNNGHEIMNFWGLSLKYKPTEFLNFLLDIHQF